MPAAIARATTVSLSSGRHRTTIRKEAIAKFVDHLLRRPAQDCIVRSRFRGILFGCDQRPRKSIAIDRHT
jgi:hypothetical protein